MKRIDGKHALMRAKYCRKGYHKLTSSYIGQGSRDKKGIMRTIYIRFLKCAHCNYMFFANKKSKDKYVKMKQEEKARLQTAFSALVKYSSSAKSKHHKGVGKCKAGDVSARDKKKLGVGKNEDNKD